MRRYAPIGLVLAGLLGLMLMLPASSEPLTGDGGPTVEEFNALEARVTDLEQRVDELEATPEPTPTPAPTETPDPTEEPTPTPTPDPDPTEEPSPTPEPTPGDCTRPGADNTGHTGTLTDYTGPPKITEPGTVIEGANITDGLTINAPNVTIRNSRVTGLILVDKGGTDALVTHVSALGGVAVSSAHRATVEYTELGNYGGEDSLHLTSDDGVHIDGLTVRNSWINPDILKMVEGAHYDGVHVRGAKNVLLECNAFDLGAWQFEYNAAVFFEWANGGYSGVRIVDNWIVGGAFGVFLSAADSEANRVDALNGNRFSGDFHWSVCRADYATAVPKEQVGNTLAGVPFTPCP